MQLEAYWDIQSIYWNDFFLLHFRNTFYHKKCSAIKTHISRPSSFISNSPTIFTFHFLEFNQNCIRDLTLNPKIYAVVRHSKFQCCIDHRAPVYRTLCPSRTYFQIIINIIIYVIVVVVCTFLITATDHKLGNVSTLIQTHIKFRCL